MVNANVNIFTIGIFSVAYGVVSDIATPAERGSYVAAVSFAYDPTSLLW